jgi:septal ring factor EnvC (AmiA/AmiB activator)
MTNRICHHLFTVVSSAVLSGVLLAVANGGAVADTPRKLQPRTTTAPTNNIPTPAPSSTASGKIEKTPDTTTRSNKRLKEINREINAARDKSKALTNQAKSLDTNIRTLRQGMVSAARLIQYHESRVTELTRQLDELNKIVAEKEQNLKHRRKQIGRVILALHKVSQYPPESLLVSPIEPGDAVRSAILLRSTMPELESRALILREDLKTLNETRAEAAKQKIELSSASTELESQRKLLRTLIGRKSRLRRRTLAKSNQAKKKVRTLANQARSIRDLMSRLELLRKKREQQAKEQAKAIARSKVEQKSNPSATKKLAETIPNLQRPRDFTGKDLATARGKLPYPAIGPVVAQYGEKAKSGLHHKGLTIETSSGAQVIAPYEGRVAFSGTFRGYGELLIIEHREGYHTLLAGMSRIDGVVGQWLLAGEPVGVMETTQSAAIKDKPTLYLEMRHKGQPINPLPWLTNRNG